MASLITQFMAGLTLPNGFWEGIIGWLYNIIGDYGFTILILSVVLKLLVTPIDYLQRKSTTKLAVIQEKMQEVQQKYGDDQQMLQQKQMELYKQKETSPMGFCGVMLLYLAITLVVFFTLFGAMNNITRHSIENQYSDLREAYYSVPVDNPNNVTPEEKQARDQAVLDCYNEIKTSWLWVENIWRSDTMASPIASFDEYKNSVSTKIPDDQIESVKAEYELIMNPLRESVRSNNGYYILIILAGLTSFFMMFINQLQQKRKNKDKPKEEKEQGRILSADGKTENGKKPNPANSKFMKYFMVVLLPIVMILITLGYAAAFAIYIVAFSLVSMCSNLVFNKIIKNKDNKKEEKHFNEIRPEYSRY